MKYVAIIAILWLGNAIINKIRSKVIAFNEKRNEIDSHFYGIVAYSKYANCSINGMPHWWIKLIVCNYGLCLKQHWISGGGYKSLDLNKVSDVAVSEFNHFGDDYHVVKLSYEGNRFVFTGDVADVWIREFDARRKANQSLQRSP